VGGPAGGSMASEIVVEMTRQHAKSLGRTEILHGYQAIEQEILNRQQQYPKYKSMGATVAELRIDSAKHMAIWGHFGDSRIYWIRNNKIMSITDDHSVVKNLVYAGLISEQEAQVHPKKNILLGAFGVVGEVAPEVLKDPVCLIDGDVFLLCTDGVWNCVSNHEILNMLQTSSNVEEWINKLELKIKGSPLDNKDNYTAIGVWITFSSDRTIQII
jgi:serine/threonine protein phosphatase PrpC